MPEYLDMVTASGDSVELFDTTEEGDHLLLTMKLNENADPDDWKVTWLSPQDARDLVKACTDWLWVHGEVI